MSPEKLSPENSADHSPDTLHKLVYMANQIGKFFASQGEDQAVAGTLDHLKKFWDPRMRAQIVTPIVRDGRVVAIVSLHQLGRTRRWSEDEIAAASETARKVSELL